MTVHLPADLVPARSIATDVLVIGAGPAGLAAARQLRQCGVDRVLVVDRDVVAGGMPRWCSHSPFGMREFARVLGGPAYGDRLADAALKAGARLMLKASVLRVGNGKALAATPEGMTEISARRVLLATGLREESRAGRLIGGERPPKGILTTGSLQYYLGRDRLPLPFSRPVVVGSELVSLSALLSLRSAGIRPLAMLEERPQPVVNRALALFPRLLGAPLRCNVRVESIHGAAAVEAITVSVEGRTERIDCDGIVLTGRFRPESSLAHLSGLAIDPLSGGPVVDADGRTSDPTVFAAGNLLRGVETAGWCWAEGRAVARSLAADLDRPQQGDGRGTRAVEAGDGIALVVPQRLSRGKAGHAHKALQVRLDEHLRGQLLVSAGGRIIHRQAIDSGPERRILLPMAALASHDGDGPITLSVERSP